MNPFEHAKQNAKPDCHLCHGTGSYMYDHNHGTICNLCCKHDLGYWLLTEGYNGYRAGVDTWCCSAGCGHKKDTQ